MELDLKPALDEQQLDKRLLSDFQKHANSDFCNALGELLPQKLIPAAVERSGIPPHEKVHDLTREQRAALRTLLKHWSIDVLSPMPVENAIITSGRRQGRGDRPENDGVEEGAGAVFCR